MSCLFPNSIDVSKRGHRGLLVTEIGERRFKFREWLNNYIYIKQCNMVIAHA